MDTSINGTQPGALTEEAFFADRKAFWGTFTRFVTGVAIALAVLMALMAFFLT